MKVVGFPPQGPGTQLFPSLEYNQLCSTKKEKKYIYIKPWISESNGDIILPYWGQKENKSLSPHATQELHSLRENSSARKKMF